MRSEFIAFLKEYGVIGLAIAVVIGGKANALVTALVDGVLMPAVTFFLPSGAWRTATLDVGLRFKPVHPSEPVYSARVGRGYRALAMRPWMSVPCT